VDGILRNPGRTTALAALAGSLALGACSAPTAAPPAGGDSPIGGGPGASGTPATSPGETGPIHGNWKLASYGSAGSPQAVPAGVEVTAKFVDGTVSGRGGCNQYSATYIQVNDSLTIGPATTTMMACPEPAMSVEQAYLAALDKTATFSQRPDSLTLRTEDGQALVYQPAPVADLEGTSWTVTGYNNGQQAVVTPIVGTTISLMFADKKASGKACNSYGGAFSAGDDGTIHISQLTNTLMACPDPPGVMEQEQQYLAALPKAATWQIEGPRLTIRDPDGAILVTAAVDVVTR
jgi:heat shock protein HslJ